MSNLFNLSCPKCRSGAHLDILASVWVRLTDDGTDADEAEDGSHFWDAGNLFSCDCGATGRVSDLRERG